MVRSLATLVLVVLGACGGAAPSAGEQPPKVDPRVELAKMNVPGHSAAAMAERAEPMLVTTKGSLSATLNGHAQQFTSLPVGGNAAIWAPATRVARVLVGGSQDKTGFPALRLVLEGVRLDTTSLPATFPLGKPAGAAAFVRSDDPQVPISPPRPRLVYEIEARKIWETDPDGPVVGAITLESFDGKRLKGTFSASVKPRSVAFGPPLEITDGQFDIEIRLNGIAPPPG